MVVGGRVVVFIPFPPLHGRRWGIAWRIVDGNHGWIVTAWVLVEMGDFADDVEAGIAPEVALNEANIMDSSWKSDALASLPRCTAMSPVASYIVALIAKGVPRNTGIVCVSFLYGTLGPSWGSG